MFSLTIKGVIPPMITPFTAAGEVDYKAFIENIELWNQADLAGLLVNGSNSETAYLNSQEQLDLVKLAAKHIAPGRFLIAGTGSESLRETQNLTKACADLGAEAALVLTPHYYDSAMTSSVLINFFSRVAESSPIPILIYNVPKFTHVNLKKDAVEVLSKHPNIIGMKDSTGNIAQLAEFINAAYPHFQILVGTASAWYPALAMGVRAGILALANCHPNECAVVQRYWDEGNHQKALAIHQILFPLNDAVTAAYGIPGLKYACSARGYRGGHVRLPLMDLSQQHKNALDAVLNTASQQLSDLLNR